MQNQKKKKIKIKIQENMNFLKKMFWYLTKFESKKNQSEILKSN